MKSLAVFLLAFLFAPTASAQVFTGRIDVTIEDSTGARLPGVLVDLTGPVNQARVADRQGQSHFLNLPVGIYAVTANPSGFNPYTNNDVQVATGSATPLAVRLAVAGTAEIVHVTAASPIVDVRRETTTTHVTIEELQNIPTARDPWVVMQTVPTIYVDRVNVGGSESGQQSNYIGKGAVGTDNTWSIDGVPITDMGATGLTPTYYDFDMFQEMAVTTGGADVQNPTPGVQLNLVLKKGVNTPHGSTRFYFENERLQGNNLSAAIAQATGSTSPACVASGYTRHCGNRTEKYQDYGFELGGPLVKDKLWGWGSIGKTDVTNLAITGIPDATTLKNYAFKADAAANSSVRANFTFFEGNKVKSGLSVGPTRPIETAWNQDGPIRYFKGEGNFVAGQNLFASARYAYISGTFSLTPIGGTDKDFYTDDALVWHNSYYFYKTTRPQYYAGGDASYFAGKHEVKFGFSYRKTPVESTSQVTGHKIITFWNNYPNLIAQAQQDYNLNTTGRYMNGFVTDTVSLNRLTVIAGVRFDHQTSSFSATHTDAVPGFPLLPAIDAPAVDNAYVFNNVTPRVGITYALDEAHKTIGRASYAMFASQLPANAASFVSPNQPYTYVYYNAIDRDASGKPCTAVGVNGCDGVAQLSEILFSQGLQGSNNVDLTHPGVVSTSNKIGNISAPRTQELMVGVDHEVMANFGVSATFTYRYMNNFLWNPRNGVTVASYAQTGTFTGTFANVGTVSVPFYGSSVAQPGYTAQNRPDYHRRYLGVELSATKRMSNHWMGRFGFASTSWNEYFDAADAILDKTPTPSASDQYANTTAAGPLVNGGPVVVSSSGSGKSSLYLIAPKYQMSANGLYQGPWGINLGASFVMRQGYGEPFFRSRVASRDSVILNKNLLIAAGDDTFRLDAVSTLDARVEKMFKLQKASFALDFDAFNLFNTGTTLGLQYDARSTAYNTIQEIINPRIARLGVRFMF